MSILTVATFHGVEASDALRAAAAKYAQRLDRFAGDISMCQVAFKSDTQRRRSHRYSVRVSVAMRDKSVEAEYGCAPNAEDEDMYTLLAHAFDVATRRVEDHVRRRRSDVKYHTPHYPAL